MSFGQSSAPAQAHGNASTTREFKKRCGLIPLIVGADFMIVGKDRKRRQFTVKSRRIEMAKLDEQGRIDKVKIVCRCLRCKKDYPSVAAMNADIEAHPSQKEMEQAEEAHPYAYFSDDLSSEADAAKIVVITTQIGALERSRTNLVAELGKIDDAEKYSKLSGRIEAVSADIAKLGREQSELSEKRIGLMSDEDGS